MQGSTVNDTPIVQRADSLEELALRINTEFAVAEAGQRQAIVAYRSIGQALIEAKAKCGGHGKWLPWLKANVPFSQRQANSYMRLAKLEVTSNLEAEWRVILGNDADEEEPEESPQVPTSPRVADQPDSSDAADDTDTGATPEPKPAIQPSQTDSTPTASDWCEAGVEQFREVISHLRKARELFDELLRTRTGKFLAEVEIASDERLFTLQLHDTANQHGRRVKKVWLANPLEILIAAAERVRPTRICAGCQGRPKGCPACMGSGFVPADGRLLETYSQRELKFGDPGVPWDVSQ